MKPIVKKIIESGLVDRHAVQLMEKWGQVDRGASDLVGRQDLRAATETSLTKFAEEVEGLIEQDREEVRETKLAIQVGSPILATYGGQKIVLFRDNMGNFLFPLTAEGQIIPGSLFQTTDDVSWVVLSSEKLFVGDQPYTIQVQASRAG
jgi:hypothetical protein